MEVQVFIKDMKHAPFPTELSRCMGKEKEDVAIVD